MAYNQEFAEAIVGYIIVVGVNRIGFDGRLIWKTQASGRRVEVTERERHRRRELRRFHVSRAAATRRPETGRTRGLHASVEQ